MASAANQRFDDARAFQTQVMLMLQQSPGGLEEQIDYLRSVFDRYENG